MQANQMRAGEGTLVQASTLVADAKVDFDKLSANLTEQILAAQSRWQGEGGKAFFGLQQAWSDKQRIIVAALDKFQSELGSTQTVFTGADEGAKAGANANIHRLGAVQS